MITMASSTAGVIYWVQGIPALVSSAVFIVVMLLGWNWLMRNI